jgi:hypothetical protein
MSKDPYQIPLESLPAVYNTKFQRGVIFGDLNKCHVPLVAVEYQ